MAVLIGYNILSKIYQSSKTTVYRGIRLKDNKHVILKMINAEYPSPEDISYLKYEFNILKTVNSPYIIQAFDLENIETQYVLVLEDMPNAVSLSVFIEENIIDLDLFLLLTIEIAHAVYDLHRAHIIHKDINPRNIIISKKTHKIKLIDLSIATQLSQERREAYSAEGIEGTLPYISPELTGRMNRPMDQRTDLYSMGVTFYEMLVGHLPFEAKDAAEWIYCHLAKQPKAPHEIAPEIPELISAIIMRLLAKSPEDRYRTAYGLINDLERFTQHWKTNHEAITFPLGEKDIAGLFQLSNKIYGREDEIRKIFSIFERISNDEHGIVFVRGYSGIGKTSLVNEIHKPIVKKQGYFASGKCEQFQQKLPYNGLIQAFRKLLQQILSENQIHLDYWKEQLLAALSPNAQVIIDVIPEVEYLIGKQPPVAKLPQSEARGRFELIFSSFVRTFATVDHPLVIFLDDLQWTDLASLDLIKQFMGDGTLNYFLIIGSYRDNEVTMDHPLIGMINDLIKSKVPLEDLEVGPLQVHSIIELLNDTFGKTSADINALAELVNKKTAGNPFFINTFLNTVHDNGYIYFDDVRREWQWDMSTLNKLTMAENVVDLIISRIERLSPKTQEVLRIASCIGNQFGLYMLTMSSNTKLEETIQNLWPALQDNLVIPLFETYILARVDHDYIKKHNLLYKFSHDRIQQAALSGLTPEENKSIHFKLAWLLLENTPEDKIDENIFDIVNHFNASLELLTDAKQRNRVAKLNFIAANKARTAIAYESATSYYLNAINLLGDRAWEDNYDIALDTHIGYAECILLLGKFLQAEELFAKIFVKAKTNLDKARISMHITLSYSVQSKWERAIDAGLAGLQFLGIKMRKKPSKLEVLMQLIAIKWMLRGKKLEDIFNLPVLTDPGKKLVTEFLERVSVAGYIVDPNLIALTGLIGMRYAYHHGYTSASAVSIHTYGMVLAAGFGNYGKAHQCAKIGLQIVDKLEDQRLRAIIYFTASILFLPWKLPYKECFTYLDKAYQLGIQVGDLLYTSYAAALIPQMMLLKGDELADVANKLKIMTKIPEFTGNVDALGSIRSLERILPVLQGEKPVSYFQERVTEFMNYLIPYTHMVTYGVSGTLCLMTAYILEDWDSALQIIKRTKPYARSPHMAIVFMVSEYFFFSSLTLLSQYHNANFLKKRLYLFEIKSNLRRLKKWATLCPENYEAKYQLVLGGLKLVTGKSQEALKAFDLALASAHESRMIFLEAIINEFIGRLYTTQRLVRQAKLHLQYAAMLYERWGAHGKVNALQQHYQELFVTTTPTEASLLTTPTRQMRVGLDLDIRAVVKSVQAISSKVILEDLIHSLVKIAIENAGAMRGLLLLEKGNKFYVAAKCEAGDIEPLLSENVLADESQDVCLSLIDYVKRTQKAIVLDDAARQGNYTEDPYILRKQPHSILCVPILHKGQVLGALYLENNLVKGAFPPSRVELLQLLSGQAAISLENARLYHAYDRYVPHEFLDILGKHSIIDIELGDSVQKKMVILFCDIRDFTALSEKMTPTENFRFINEFLSYMEPVIKKNGGFIDKFIGDSIMALFPGESDHALSAGIAMQKALDQFNKARIKKHSTPIRIGIGINIGNLILGTIGGKNRFETTVVSDAVNIASRIEGLTKVYDSRLLISDATLHSLKVPELYHCRFVGRVQIRGKQQEVDVWEVYSADTKDIRALKSETASLYNKAIKLFYGGAYQQALEKFKKCQMKLPADKVIQLHIEECLKHINQDTYRFVQNE